MKSGIKQKTTSKKNTELKLKTSYMFLIISYIVLTTFMPAFGAIDSSGTKFLVLTLLNLLTFCVLLIENKSSKLNPRNRIYFSNWPALFYMLYVIISFFSILQSINQVESIFNFVKILTVFISFSLIVSMISDDTRYISLICTTFNFVLIFDCLIVFYYLLFGNKTALFDFSELSIIYSNKNILAAAIFIKLPVALRSYFFEPSKQKRLGIIAFVFGVICLLILGTRAFYLGLVILTILFAIFSIFNSKFSLKKVFIIPSIIVFTILLFIVLQFFYFQKTGISNQTSILGKITSIEFSQTGSSGRLDTWFRTIDMIKEKPLLGVGTGNWKIEMCKIEGPLKNDYTYMSRNHNDFLEITAEIGVVGGVVFTLMLFCSLFILFKTSKQNDAKAFNSYLFIPAMGLVCFAVDSFFNFPAERPEIQLLFAIYMAMACLFTGHFRLKFQDKIYTFFLTIIKQATGLKQASNWAIFALLLFCVYVYISDVKHLQLVHTYKQEMNAEKLTKPANLFVNGFPWIPNLSPDIEPVAVIKARYLLRDQKYDEAILLLNNDESNIYDARKAYFLGMAYLKQHKIDLAIANYKKVYALKPMELKSFQILCDLLEKNGNQKEAIQLLNNYLLLNPGEYSIYTHLAEIYFHKNDLKKAIGLLDQAINVNHSKTNEVNELKNSYQNAVLIKPYEKLYNAAVAFNKSGEFKLCFDAINEFIKKEPRLALAYELRASCYFFMKQYRNSLFDIQTALAKGLNSGPIYNLRGMNFNEMGNKSAACKDFETAISKGDKNAVINLQRFCNAK